MSLDLSKYLVIGISSRALFNLEYENKIFSTKGVKEYSKCQLKNQNKILKPGTGFPLVKALLNLNGRAPKDRKTEVIIMSRNNAEMGLRICNSIKRYKLDIQRSSWTSGTCVTSYLQPFKVHLFLSADEEDVQVAIRAGVAAAKIYPYVFNKRRLKEPISQIRIAFDGDAVLFSDEAENIYKTKGMKAFLKHEIENAKKPLPEGPFAKLLKTLSSLQSKYNPNNMPIRTVLITARNMPAHERVIRTLTAWNVRIDESFFMGGVDKHEILKAFKPHIFFDDQDVYCAKASKVVPTAIVSRANNTKKRRKKQ